jgi:hypothetical protein
VLRRYRNWSHRVAGLIAVWGAAACDDERSSITDLPGGTNVVQPVFQPRRQGFSLGAARSDMAVLARDAHLYAVQLSAAAQENENDGLECLTHVARRLWLPEGSKNSALVEGLAINPDDAARSKLRTGSVRLTAIHDFNTDEKRRTVFDLPTSVAGAGQIPSVTDPGDLDYLYFYTRPHVPTESASVGSSPGANAGTVSVEASSGATTSEHTVLVLAEATHQEYGMLTLEGEVFDARALDDHQLLIVAGPAGRHVEAITVAPGKPPSGKLELPKFAKEAHCGISVNRESTCTFYGLGEARERDCGEEQADAGATSQSTLDAGMDALDASMDSGDGPNEPAPPPCAVGWSAVSLSQRGCVAGMVNTITGELFIAPVPKASDCASVTPRSVSTVNTERRTNGASSFNFVLSPLGYWAAVYSTQPSDTPVQLVSLVDGKVRPTAATRVQAAHFACAGQDDCMLWVVRDGSSSAPGVMAISAATGATVLSCPSPLPIVSGSAGAALQLWARERATWVGADSLGQQVLLQHADLSSNSCPWAPLDAVPVCLGSLGSGSDFVCSANRDGDIAKIEWATDPKVTHHQHFGVATRSSTPVCKP